MTAALSAPTVAEEIDGEPSPPAQRLRLDVELG